MVFVMTQNVFYSGKLYHRVIDPDKLHHGMLHYSLCVVTWSAGSVFNSVVMTWDNEVVALHRVLSWL